MKYFSYNIKEAKEFLNMANIKFKINMNEKMDENIQTGI